MKTKANFLQARLWSGALGMLVVVFPGKGDERATQPTPDGAPQKLAEAIPWSQIGAKTGANYQGDGLAVTATTEGARLRCVFQKLDGEATSEGLWLTSTVPDQPNERFRVTAVSVGREGRAGSPLPADGAPGVTRPTRLPVTGEVSVDDQTVRFIRPGLVEEYTVSMDGVRQDFVVMERPPLTPSLPRNPVGTRSTASPSGFEKSGTRVERVPTEFEGRLMERVADRPGEGELRLELAVTGARVESIVGGVHPVRNAGQAVDHERGNMLSHGARLVLEKSGRKIAYSRLRVTDATGKELPARMEVLEDGARRSRRFDVESAAGAEDNLDALEMSAVKRPEGRAPRLAVVVDDAQAVYPIRIDPTFSDANWISMSGLPGADSSVHAAVVDGSGNLYIGGNFTVVGDVAASRIAKWNGSSWSALGFGMNGPVFALLVSGADLYAGGQFTTAGGSNANYVAKWNGSSWSALGSGVNSRVRALTASGSDLYAAGEFTTAGDNGAAAFVAKWDGTNWSALGSGVNSPAYALAASGSDLYAGGAFTHATNSGGVAVPVNGIAKWNGTNWSALGSGMAGLDITVHALAVSGTNVYAGGAFTIAGGSAMRHIAKWNGSSWSGLSSGMPSYGYVQALAVSGNDLYAGGWFSATANGTQAKYVAKWNGSSWSTLGSGMGGSASPYVNALAVSGSTVYAGGLFTTAGGTAANRIAKWNGGSWSALRSGLNGLVYAVAVSGSNLYAGGYFTTAGGSEVNRIAKWNGSSWSALGSGMNGYYVYALAVSGSDLCAGGWFTTAGGSAANYIAKWNGSSWCARFGDERLGGCAGGVGQRPVCGGRLHDGGRGRGQSDRQMEREQLGRARFGDGRLGGCVGSVGHRSVCGGALHDGGREVLSFSGASGLGRPAGLQPAYGHAVVGGRNAVFLHRLSSHQLRAGSCLQLVAANQLGWPADQYHDCQRCADVHKHAGARHEQLLARSLGAVKLPGFMVGTRSIRVPVFAARSLGRGGTRPYQVQGLNVQIIS